MNISVIGLGKLGICTAACFAAAGHRVYGYDTDDFLRNELRAARNPIDETGLTELLNSAWDNLITVDSYESAGQSSDITLIPRPVSTTCRWRLSGTRSPGAMWWCWATPPWA